MQIYTKKNTCRRVCVFVKYPSLPIITIIIIIFLNIFISKYIKIDHMSYKTQLVCYPYDIH